MYLCDLHAHIVKTNLILPQSIYDLFESQTDA